MLRQQERETIDEGFEIVPMKFCSPAESEERRFSIVNVAAVFQFIKLSVVYRSMKISDGKK